MITATNVSKRFGNFTALDQITCSIQSGCVYGMVGSNGAGKSTFLRCVAGVYKPDAGTITVEGQSVWENPAVKAKIAYVPDELFFLGSCTLNRMRDLYRRLFPKFEVARYNSLIKDFGLDPKKPVTGFSKGMRRQAAIILALASRPDYLFFDETFDGLDPVMRSYVKNLIGEDTLQGATAIVTSHSLRELEDLCDSLALLHKGGLVLQNDVDHLKTTRYKIQVAFDHTFDRSDFNNIEIIRFQKQGSVANLIVKGNREETVAKIRRMQPKILDVLPLTLEEVFTYEMEALGYVFGQGVQA